ncbi:hypothetical protein ACFLTU_07085 [Bacteroidota bacterium]
MKNTDFHSKDFRDLTAEESISCNGGGFAYDAGRFIRFAIICGPGLAGIGNAIGDAVATKFLV